MSHTHLVKTQAPACHLQIILEQCFERNPSYTSAGVLRFPIICVYSILTNQYHSDIHDRCESENPIELSNKVFMYLKYTSICI